MHTFINTKKITSNLFYELLKETFSEFLKDGINYSEKLGYGIKDNTIVIQEAQGKELFSIEVTPELITANNPTDSHKKLAQRLDEFIHACLL